MRPFLLCHHPIWTPQHGKTCRNCAANGRATAKEEPSSEDKVKGKSEPEPESVSESETDSKTKVKAETEAGALGEGTPQDRGSRECPLRAAGLLVRRGTTRQIKKEANGKIKAEAGDARSDDGGVVEDQVKMESSASEAEVGPEDGAEARDPKRAIGRRTSPRKKAGAGAAASRRKR